MPDPVLPNLHDCLEATSWRRLLALMASHGLACSTRWRKADLIAALHAHLLNPVTWQRGIPDLGAPARSALETIVQAGGRLPATTFLGAFGPVRPHRPWRADAPQEAPWQNPASPTERLWYLGLLYLQPPKAGPGAPQQAILPAELLPIVRSLLLTPAADQPARLLPRPGRPPDLAWHVALLLATIAAEPVAPVRDRWLPPTIGAALANRLGLDQAPDYTPRRSEHYTPYLAFVHLVAEAADLLTSTPRFAITPAGWQWLAAPAAERWSTLWAAWLAAPTELTRSYRFPWAGVPRAGRELVLDELRRSSPNQFRPLQQIVAACHLRDPHGYLAQPWRVAEDVAAALITGPLFWFGAVDVAATVAEDPPAPPVRADDEAGGSDDLDLADPAYLPDATADPDACASAAAGLLPPHEADVAAGTSGSGRLTPPILTASGAADATCGGENTGIGRGESNINRSATIPPRLVRLNLTGAGLLGLPDCAAPDFPDPAPCSSASDPDLLRVPVTASPIHLARLAPLAEWLPPAPPAMTQLLRLTALRVGQAVANGLPLPQLFDNLRQALGRPPSRRQMQRLRGWAAAGQQVRIRPLTVLETAEAALLGRLRSRKLLRQHLGEAISPTRAILDPAGVAAVVQHLATLGIYAAVETAAGPIAPAVDGGSPALPTSDIAGPAPAPRWLSPALAGQLLLAGLVYRGLGEHIALAAPLAADLLDDLAGQLDAQQQAAARHAAQQTLEALAATLRGYLGFPAWQADHQTGDLLPVIEHALAHQQDLLLTYWGAAREQPTVRRVTPYWIERRQAVPYLIGYCHLREAERVFRLDRIADCQPLPRPAAAPQPYDD